MLLAEGIFVGINPEDDDLAHLVCVESVTHTTEGLLHKQAHLESYVKKGKPQPIEDTG